MGFDEKACCWAMIFNKVTSWADAISTRKSTLLQPKSSVSHSSPLLSKIPRLCEIEPRTGTGLDGLEVASDN